MHWRRWSPKWWAAMRVAKERGWTFHIHDEARIQDAALYNIRFLQRYKRMRFPDDDSQWLSMGSTDVPAGFRPLDGAFLRMP